MSKSKANTSVLYDEDFFEVITISQGMLNYADPDVAPRLLAPDAANESLGHVLRQGGQLDLPKSVDWYLSNGYLRKVNQRIKLN
jgi:hypothetical protein